VRDGDAPNDPGERLKREEHDLARLVPDDLAEAKGGDHHYANEPAKHEDMVVGIAPLEAPDTYGGSVRSRDSEEFTNHAELHRLGTPRREGVGAVIG
jgi:hypothetical protein